MNESDDPFFRHEQAPRFMEATLTNYNQTGVARIPASVVAQLATEHGLQPGEAAALSYLAKFRVEEFLQEVDGSGIGPEAELYLMTNTPGERSNV